MSTIAQRLSEITTTLPEGVRLVAVSKFHPVEALREAYDAGQRIFGESRVQELIGKIEAMPDDTVWHFIGHLQTNKVRAIVGKVAMIESVDTPRLAGFINRAAADAGVVQPVLLQLHVAQEETKFGFTPDELLDWLATDEWRNLTSLKLCGVMGMASNTDDQERIRQDFTLIAETRRRIVEAHPDLADTFATVSMGMSHDYLQAIACGSNLVRVGTYIFGERT